MFGVTAIKKNPVPPGAMIYLLGTFSKAAHKSRNNVYVLGLGDSPQKKIIWSYQGAIFLTSYSKIKIARGHIHFLVGHLQDFEVLRHNYAILPNAELP